MASLATAGLGIELAVKSLSARIGRCVNQPDKAGKHQQCGYLSIYSTHPPCRGPCRCHWKPLASHACAAAALCCTCCDRLDDDCAPASTACAVACAGVCHGQAGHAAAVDKAMGVPSLRCACQRQRDPWTPCPLAAHAVWRF